VGRIVPLIGGGDVEEFEERAAGILGFEAEDACVEDGAPGCPRYGFWSDCV